jgi:hypothetical protein
MSTNVSRRNDAERETSAEHLAGVARLSRAVGARSTEYTLLVMQKLNTRNAGNRCQVVRSFEVNNVDHRGLTSRLQEARVPAPKEEKKVVAAAATRKRTTAKTAKKAATTRAAKKTTAKRAGKKAAAKRATKKTAAKRTAKKAATTRKRATTKRAAKR